MNIKNRQAFHRVFKFTVIVLFTIATHSYAESTRKMVATGVTLNNVRVQILSTDQSTGITEVKFSGEDCGYCDDVYLVDETTQIHTVDYRGPIDLQLLADRIFVRGSARVIRADKWVQEVGYVDSDE